MKPRSGLPREFSIRMRKKILSLFSLYEFTYWWHTSLLASCFWTQSSEGREGTGGGGLLSLGHSLALPRAFLESCSQTDKRTSLVPWHHWFISRSYEIDLGLKLIFTNRLYEIAFKLTVFIKMTPNKSYVTSAILFWPYSDKRKLNVKKGGYFKIKIPSGIRMSHPGVCVINLICPKEAAFIYLFPWRRAKSWIVAS